MVYFAPLSFQVPKLRQEHMFFNKTWPSRLAKAVSKVCYQWWGSVTSLSGGMSEIFCPLPRRLTGAWVRVPSWGATNWSFTLCLLSQGVITFELTEECFQNFYSNLFSGFIGMLPGKSALPICLCPHWPSHELSGFTKVFALVFALLHDQGIHFLGYLPHLLLKDKASLSPAWRVFNTAREPHIYANVESSHNRCKPVGLGCSPHCPFCRGLGHWRKLALLF